MKDGEASKLRKSCIAMNDESGIEEVREEQCGGEVVKGRIEFESSRQSAKCPAIEAPRDRPA